MTAHARPDAAQARILLTVSNVRDFAIQSLASLTDPRERAVAALNIAMVLLHPIGSALAADALSVGIVAPDLEHANSITGHMSIAWQGSPSFDPDMIDEWEPADLGTPN